MKIRDGQNAVVDITKLRGYCLNRWHPRGRHKARLFETRAGLLADDAEAFQERLLKAAARSEEAVLDEGDEFGLRYRLDIDVEGPRGATVTIRSLWRIRRGESFPRLTTCYVL